MMDKRALAKVPIEVATPEMVAMAEKLHENNIVTASVIEGKKILLLNFYETAKLKEGKTAAVFRTFLSKDDYITQDLSVSKVKWKTAAFDRMEDFCLQSSRWDSKKGTWVHKNQVAIRSQEESDLIKEFFAEYNNSNYGRPEPWDRVYKFQDCVKEARIMAQHKKETDPIDKIMEPIKDAEPAFYDWVWDQGMSFSQYLIYKDIGEEKALCECTRCKGKGVVDRKTIRLRNNEKGHCPFCGEPVTIKAKGRMPATIQDERWFAYVDPLDTGFVFRYFRALREIRSDGYIDAVINKARVEEHIRELVRVIYKFPKGKSSYKREIYEWGVYKQRGLDRWCPDMSRFGYMSCILYPGNLPKAWEHTPMKYSALEYISGNAPTKSARYEEGIDKYIKYPKLEWICKMGLSNLAIDLISGRWHGPGKVDMAESTIYKILGLNKVNTKILQAVDGGIYHLRLLQVAQKIGLNFKPEELLEYYETFECNTELLKQANRKVSLYKLVKYISRESLNYPVGDRACVWAYSYKSHEERPDQRIERKQNMAKDWLEYLDWCKALKYDLNNMFIYMPKNFRKVHDRTAQEYQELLDKRAAAEKRRREEAARKAMEETRKAMAEIFDQNEGVSAFTIKGKGLILVVPSSGDEIRTEGTALHHCVGGYVERVAKGETNIFFVRKAAEPDKPYFTMEWSHNHVVQCRGAYNCGMPSEVKAFVNVFEKKMQEKTQPKKKRKMKVVA